MKPLKFTNPELCRAFDEWGCNCGPAALAAMAELTMEEARLAVEAVAFSQRRWMNLTAMHGAAKVAGFRLEPVKDGLLPRDGLIRIQRHGPWMLPGVPFQARFRYTHWIGSHFDSTQGATVYDVNWGWVRYDDWRDVISRKIMEAVRRCDGTFSMADRLELVRA